MRKFAIFSSGLILKEKFFTFSSNFSLKIRPELKIANFLITIGRIFCDLILTKF